MNRSTFFNIAKITKSPLTVIQEDEKGYYITMTYKNEEEEEETITLMYQNEPRYFKSLGGIETTLKAEKLFNFSVKMKNVEVSVKKRIKEEITDNTTKDIFEEEKTEVQEETAKRPRKKVL